MSLLETSIDALSAENVGVSVSVIGNDLHIKTQTPISSVEVYNISGIKFISQPCAIGNIDITYLTKGTYIVRVQTADGRSLSVKFNK
jgi:hypothetical protein